MHKSNLVWKKRISITFQNTTVSFDVFSAVTNLEGLVKPLVEESNLSAWQKGR